MVNYRYMRMLVMFDLPVITSGQKREYRKFRKFLVENGFYMLQQSVYCKLVLNQTVANTVLKNIELNKPPEGLVQSLVITERQFSNMQLIVGKKETDVVNTDKRVVDL